MNERIRQLAEQAGFSKDKYDLYWDDDANAEGVDLEKFAELIVRECAGIACEHMELNEGTDYNIGSKIQKHFGVEE